MFCFAALVNVVVFPFVAGGRRGSVGRLVAGALSGAALARLGDVVARHLDAISFSSRLCCGGAAEGAQVSWAFAGLGRPGPPPGVVELARGPVSCRVRRVIGEF